MRLSDDELELLFDKVGVSPEGRAYVRRVRTSPPARRVQGRGGNVTVRYASRKMKVIIQAESHRNELAFIYEMEHNPNVLEYYDQPEHILLTYLVKGQRKPRSQRHTDDFLVIEVDGIYLDECKTEEELTTLAEQSPNRYVQGDGRWYCPPGEHATQPLGIRYRIRSSAEINWIFQRNFPFIADYLRDDRPLVSEEATEVIRTHVVRAPGITLRELLEATASEGVSSDDIYTLIATERLYVDLRKYVLAEPERVPVYHSEQIAMASATAAEAALDEPDKPSTLLVTSGSKIIWDGKPLIILFRGENSIALKGEGEPFVELENPVFEALVKQGKITGVHRAEQSGLSAEAIEILARASAEDLAEANHRCEAVLAALAGRPLPFTVPERSLRDWKRRYREAEKKWGLGYIGLIKRRWLQGNREPGLPDAALALMNEFIEQHFENPKQQGVKVVWGKYVNESEQRHLPHASYPYFAAAVRKRPQHEQIRKRLGPRAAYKHEPFYWLLDRVTTPRHGDRLFEIVHIDHTQLDIELRCSRTGRNLGRPWVTLMVDAYTRRVLVVYLTFDRPSYRTCMAVIRECVRQYGRMPQTIVVDGGAEFRSTYFETLLAALECTKKTRPSGKARHGTVIERLFGTNDTEFVHNLTGNTQLTKHVRLVTKSVDPKRLAVWTLPRFYAYMRAFVDEIYNKSAHPALDGLSPDEAFVAGLQQSGYRPHRLIPYDESFRMLSSPTTSKGCAKVQPNLGVKIHGRYYWTEALRNAEVESTQVPVRYDPDNIGLAYAFVQGRWVECYSDYYAAFQGRTEREVTLATAELRKIHAHDTKKFTLSAKALAEFITSAEAEEVLLEQRLRDLEANEVRVIMAGGTISLEDPSRPQPPSPGSVAPPQRPDEPITIDIASLEPCEDF